MNMMNKEELMRKTSDEHEDLDKYTYLYFGEFQSIKYNELRFSKSKVEKAK